jgi:lipopolysaccharide assembly outer membrane protein LptD (OstA)
MFKYFIKQSILIYISLFFGLALNLFSQTKLQYQADELIGSETAQGPIREYKGNVIIIQDDIKITCSYARQIINTNTAFLKGNVIVYQGNMIMKSEEMSYDGNLKIARSIKRIEILDEGTKLVANRGSYFVNDKKSDFIGNVRIENDSTVIVSDQLLYFRESDISIAKGNANIKSKKDNIYIIGDVIENYPIEKYSIIKGNTNLIQIDSIYEDNVLILDTLKIVCDTIKSFRNENETYIFEKNVKIIKDEIFAQAEFTKLEKKKNLISFKENPMIWYEGFQLYADSILIESEGKKIKSIKAFNNSISVNKDTLYSDRFNQIEGKYITIDFIDGKMSKILAQKDSKSLYFINNENQPEGADRKNSDNIEILFNNGEAENINWIGKTTGYYIPEDKLYNSIEKYNLEKLKWTETIPEINLRQIRIKN